MESCQHDWYGRVLCVEHWSCSSAAVLPKCKYLFNKLSFKRLTLIYFALSCHTILAHCSLEGTACASTSNLGFGKGASDRLLVFAEPMHVQCPECIFEAAKGS